MSVHLCKGDLDMQCRSFFHDFNYAQSGCCTKVNRERRGWGNLDCVGDTSLTYLRVYRKVFHGSRKRAQEGSSGSRSMRERG